MSHREPQFGQAPHSRLARMIQVWCGTSEDVSTPIDGLSFFRRTRPTEPDLCLVEPALLVVAQGAKQMVVGGAPHRYDPSGFLITSLEIPGQTQIIEASPDAPCLGLIMKLNQRMLAEMVASNVIPPSERADRRSVAVGTVTPELISPLERLVALLDEPDAIPVLAPLILQEINTLCEKAQGTGAEQVLCQAGIEAFFRGRCQPARQAGRYGVRGKRGRGQYRGRTAGAG